MLDTSAAPAVTAPPLILDPSADFWQRFVNVLQWWVDRMVTTPAPIVEKMVLFWHNHFPSSLDKCDHINLWNQNVMLRQRAMGSFRDLARAVALDPAMLQYLDNDTNVVGSPNENFARELMELFTMGTGNYTQADVVASARAWTGHGLSNNNLSYVFRSTRHDAGQKTIFGITKNWDGPDVIDEICLGSKQPVTARFIASKLWTWFAYANPAAGIVDALTAAFIGSGMNITALLRAMFLRPEFYSDAAKQGHVRTPVEYMAAAMRHTGMRSADAHPEWFLDGMGQLLWYPPNVSGWRPNAAWITTSTMWAREDFARYVTWVLAGRGLFGDSKTVSVQTAVQRAFDTLGVDRPSAASRAAIESAITAERQARGWGEQANLITLALLTPEFQVA